LIWIEKFRVAAEAGKQRRLVVGRAAEPAPGQPCPLRNPITTGDEVFGRARRDEIRVGETAPFGRAGQQVFVFGMVAMQRVVEPRHHSRGIAECRVLGDVFYPLAVNPNFSTIVKAVEKLLARVGKQRRHLYGLPVKPKILVRDCFATLAMTTFVVTTLLPMRGAKRRSNLVTQRR
jgi:hypothetical protein